MKPLLSSLFAALFTAATLFAASDIPGSQDFVGTWLRPDGGYKLVVKAVNSDGKADVEYLNPSPIHVAEASVTEVDGKATLFVKLEDEGYPGSNYHLVASDAGERLTGTYFQAAAKETYDIFFVREK